MTTGGFRSVLKHRKGKTREDTTVEEVRQPLLQVEGVGPHKEVGRVSCGWGRVAGAVRASLEPPRSPVGQGNSAGNTSWALAVWEDKVDRF